MNTDLAVRGRGSVDVSAGWTPEALQEAIDRERQLRAVVVKYYRDAMIESHHFYRLDDDEKKKPALSKEGALNLCSLFKVKPLFDHPVETYFPDGHYTVRYRCNLASGATGEVIAQGDGLCSTRESKYAYRWVFDRDVPVDVDKAKLVKKEGESRKTGRKYTQYKLPNPDLANEWNTILKMSEKRALVDAVLKLSLVSELFTQDLDEAIQERVAEKRTARDPSASTGPSGTSQPETITLDDARALRGLISMVVGQANASHEIRERLHMAEGAELTVKIMAERLTPATLQALTEEYESRLKASVEQESQDDRPPPDAEMPADLQEGAHATPQQIAGLRQLARLVGEDAYVDVQDMLDQHPEGLVIGVYEIIRQRLKARQASKKSSVVETEAKARREGSDDVPLDDTPHEGLATPTQLTHLKNVARKLGDERLREVEAMISDHDGQMAHPVYARKLKGLIQEQLDRQAAAKAGKAEVGSETSPGSADY
jgi:hypothetical protein